MHASRRFGAMLKRSQTPGFRGSTRVTKVVFHSGFVDRIELDNICANIDAALERARKILEPE